MCLRRLQAMFCEQLLCVNEAMNDWGPCIKGGCIHRTALEVALELFVQVEHFHDCEALSLSILWHNLDLFQVWQQIVFNDC